MFSDAFVEELDALFRLRRDVRRFREDPVPDALLDAVFQTLETAPSVGLSQPWRIVFFESASARAAARTAFERANEDALRAQAPDDAAHYARLKLAGLDRAPVQFALFAADDPAQGRGLGRRSMPEMTAYSVVCAAMQLWLSARVRGLGLGWVSIIQPDAIAQAADAAESWTLIGYFCLGWPEDPDADRPELERAGWERRGALADWSRTV